MSILVQTGMLGNKLLSARGKTLKSALSSSKFYIYMGKLKQWPFLTAETECDKQDDKILYKSQGV